MSFLLNSCTFKNLDESLLKSCKSFDCENEDLNEFFQKDAPKYSKELLGKSYCFVLDENPKIIVCAFTISNDSIKAHLLPNGRKKKVAKPIPREKQLKNYPAVLIGRLGVNKDFGGKGIGRELMDFIKGWFIDSNNKTGCRFLVVDSYNTPKPLAYYKRNGFEPLFTTDEQEKNYFDLDESIVLKTRLMYFDLILLSS